MKKQIWLRAAIAAPYGVVISLTISLWISWSINDGVYYPVTPEAAQYFGSELAASTFLYASTLLYGAGWGAISTIWDQSRWSLTKQTAVHFALASSITLPVMWFNFWVPHTAGAVASYYALFALIYLAIWAGSYLRIKRQLAQVNEKLGESGHSQP